MSAAAVQDFVLEEPRPEAISAAAAAPVRPRCIEKALQILDEYHASVHVVLFTAGPSWLLYTATYMYVSQRQYLFQPCIAPPRAPADQLPSAPMHDSLSDAFQVPIEPLLKQAKAQGPAAAR